MMRIKELREMKGLQQKQLAIDLGVTQPTVCDWENGNKTPSFKSAVKIADYFHVTTDYLLGRDEPVTTADEENKTDLDGLEFAFMENYRELNDDDRAELIRMKNRMLELKRLKTKNEFKT